MGQQDGSASQTKRLRSSAVTRAASWMQRRTLWTTVAAVLLVAGIVVSTLAARTTARNAEVRSQRAFETGSAQIASTLKLAIVREQDLIVSASGFVIGNPSASDAKFVAWANSVHALSRYPELVGFGHSVIVPAAQLPAFAARAGTDPAGPLASDGTLRVVPAGRRAFYCLSVGSLTRSTQAGVSGRIRLLCERAGWEWHRLPLVTRARVRICRSATARSRCCPC